MPLTLSLKPQDEPGLNALLEDLYDPHSPNYRHYLTPSQFAQRFGATDAQVQKVVNFLQSRDIHVTSISANNLQIKADATVAQAERAFGVVINDYLLPDGRTAFSNAAAPSLPAEVAELITAVHGLNDTFRYHPMLVRRGAVHPDASCSGTPTLDEDGYGPSNLADAYSLTSMGLTGAGETIGLVEFDAFAASDPACYFQGYGIPAPNITVEPVDGGVSTPGFGEGEVDLDIEVLGGIAPEANILVYEEGEVTSDPNGTDIYTQIVTDDKVSVVSISWGGCEPDTGSAALTALDTILKQGATEGISFFAAAGDAGAYDCFGDQTANNSILAVDSPGSDPFVTSVGGTTLTLNGNSYGSETIWGDETGAGFCGQLTGNTAGVQTTGGGGGGYSMQFPQPSWQVGTGVVNAACVNPNGTAGGREVPDVAANADPNSGDASYSGGSWGPVGGTSAAAPTWAGVITLMNQYLKTNGQPAIGYANPALYAIFSKAGQNAFQDITVGDNLFYPATVGFDMASGMGSPNGAGLAKALDPTGVPVATPAARRKGCDVGSSTGTEGAIWMLSLLGACVGACWRRRIQP